MIRSDEPHVRPRSWPRAGGAVAVALCGALLAACGTKPASSLPVAPIAAPRAPDVEDDAADHEARDRDAARRREEQARRDAEEAGRRRDATVAEMVFFDYDRAAIRPEAQEVLRRKADVLRAYPDLRIRIEGHADERGSDEYNLALGSRRALAAKETLSRLGINPARFEIMSWGEERPLVSGHGDAAWSRNRRAAFVIMSAPTAADR